MTRRAVVILVLTCQKIYHEAEPILYNQGLFASITEQYDSALVQFLEDRLSEPKFWKPRYQSFRQELEILIPAKST